MTRTLGGPAIVLALVLAEVAIGSSAAMWLAPLWGRVRIAFYRLMGAILSAIAILAVLAARDPLTSGSAVPGAARAAVALLWVFAGLTIAWSLAVWTRGERLGRLIGLASLPVGAAALIAVAADPAAARAPAVAAFQLLAGAAFAGAATDGLLLGHWYLVDRRLSRDPLRRLNLAFLAGCVLALISGVLAVGSGAGQAETQLSPLLGAGALAAYLAVGLVVLCAMIGGFIRALIREDSLQAATGLFYLAVIMALSAEFAAKVRFF